MKEEKTPEQIFERYQKGELDKSSTVEIFKSIIEKGTSITKRALSIKLLGKLNPSVNEIFKILEYYMISDVSPVIRSSIVKIVIQDFLTEGLESLRWVIQNDTSNLVLMTVMEMLEEMVDINIPVLKNEVLLRFSKIFQVVPTEAKFFVDLYITMDKLGESLDINTNYTHSFSFKGASLHSCSTACYSPKFISVRNKHVYALYLGGFSLKNLPKSISHLTRLRFLTIYKTELRDLPEFFQDLQKLMCLRLVSNKFQKLPISISKLKNLRTLLLEEKSLKTLPSWIGRLDSLRFLDVAGSNIKKIPNSLYKLSKQKFAQKYINMGVDKLEAPILGLLELLSDGRLDKIERSDDELNSEKYDMSHYMHHFKLNEKGNVVRIYLYSSVPTLGIIPEQICSLKHIEWIYFCDNSIKHIPKKIGRLKSIKILELSNNIITKIPRSVKKLKNIQQLYLDHNRINEIPNFLKNHPMLRKIDLSDNPALSTKKTE